MECCMSKNNLLTLIQAKGIAYYDFAPAAGFRFIMLDTYDVSILGRTEVRELFVWCELGSLIQGRAGAGPGTRLFVQKPKPGFKQR